MYLRLLFREIYFIIKKSDRNLLIIGKNQQYLEVQETRNKMKMIRGMLCFKKCLHSKNVDVIKFPSKNLSKKINKFV